jgi:cold shock CspA family protein
MRGTMIFFNDEKHLGFIRTEEGERLCVRRSGFTGEAPLGRCGGMVVSFSVQEADGEREAVDVIPVPEEAHGRARRRHRGMHLG